MPITKAVVMQSGFMTLRDPIYTAYCSNTSRSISIPAPAHPAPALHHLPPESDSSPVPSAARSPSYRIQTATESSSTPAANPESWPASAPWPPHICGNTRTRFTSAMVATFRHSVNPPAILISGCTISSARS